jgi:hypothetical protein
MRHLPTTDKSYCHVTAAFRVEGHHGTYGIGLCAEGREGRQEHGGPLVPGPWGWVNQHATVIDNTGQSHREFLACPILAIGERFTVENLPGVWALAFEKGKPWERPSMQLIQVSDPSDEPK